MFLFKQSCCNCITPLYGGRTILTIQTRDFNPEIRAPGKKTVRDCRIDPGSMCKYIFGSKNNTEAFHEIYQKNYDRQHCLVPLTTTQLRLFMRFTRRIMIVNTVQSHSPPQQQQGTVLTQNRLLLSSCMHLRKYIFLNRIYCQFAITTIYLVK